MKKLLKGCSVVALGGLLVGCGSVSHAYKPSQLGNLADHRGASGIEVNLSPDKYRARIGDPVTFKVTIRNVGTDPILFPADPDLLLTWVYPDGKRDNLIRGERRGAAKMLTLAPGDEHVAHSVVTTYYFDRGGIHEFRAIVYGEQLAMNTERPAWQGRAVSNGFGVLFEGN
ncbi:MAG TPA: hypothetical protein PKE12_04910 [Kiritimatiellia bacterium]|nr:hypothetical protein [Kiritimatiellia bacterium]